MCEIGEAQHLIVRVTGDAGGGEIVGVEAGQHRDRDHLGVERGGGLGILQHRAAAAGVDGEDRGFKRPQRLDCLGDGVGNVVQLQVEEDRQAKLRHLVHAVLPMGAEEFQAELDAADMGAGAGSDRFGAGEVGRVDRDVDGAHATGSSTVAGVVTGVATGSARASASMRSQVVRRWRSRQRTVPRYR